MPVFLEAKSKQTVQHHINFYEILHKEVSVLILRHKKKLTYDFATIFANFHRETTFTWSYCGGLRPIKNPEHRDF